MAVAIPSRRSALAAATLAATALAVAAAGRSCRVVDNTPEGAVRAFAAAAAADDRDGVFALLGPDTQARLVTAAARATDLAGGSVRYGPLDLISIGRLREDAGRVRYRVVDRAEARATVEALGPGDDRGLLELVVVDGRWRIELPAYGPP